MELWCSQWDVQPWRQEFVTPASCCMSGPAVAAHPRLIRTPPHPTCTPFPHIPVPTSLFAAGGARRGGKGDAGAGSSVHVTSDAQFPRLGETTVRPTKTYTRENIADIVRKVLWQAVDGVLFCCVCDVEYAGVHCLPSLPPPPPPKPRLCFPVACGSPPIFA
jgi:hypothetical protein